MLYKVGSSIVAVTNYRLTRTIDYVEDSGTVHEIFSYTLLSHSLSEVSTTSTDSSVPPLTAMLNVLRNINHRNTDPLVSLSPSLRELRAVSLAYLGTMILLLV